MVDVGETSSTRGFLVAAGLGGLLSPSSARARFVAPVRGLSLSCALIGSMRPYSSWMHRRCKIVSQVRLHVRT